MKHVHPLPALTEQAYRRFIGTAVLLTLLTLAALQANLFLHPLADPQLARLLMGFNLGSALYAAFLGKNLTPLQDHRTILHWLNATVSGLGYSFLATYIPFELHAYFNLLLLIGVISVSVLSGRYPTLLMLAIGCLPLIVRAGDVGSVAGAFSLLSAPLAALLVEETLARTQNIARQQIHRVETINDFSRQVASTLDRAEILLMVSAAIPKAVEADSYYVGILDGDEIAVEIFYDEGEFFNDVRVKAKGSLSGWVIEHQQGLFLPDLRNPTGLDGVNVVVVGKDKTSLSWIGVPLTGTKLKGMMALASYQPNAFNNGDMELLVNLAQHTVMALENAANHAEVEERSRLDSMTNVLNHGFFLKTFQNNLDVAKSFNTPVSLIMLDVDYFKQYNDTYGHLMGDKVLLALCDTIRAHIKSTDVVGRWGGEEFIIALPGADGRDAAHVAERIRRTMGEMKLQGRDGEEIPAPTVSQGMAVFPLESGDMYELIDLADKRLYVAKERGRNQIEPHLSTWELMDK